MSGSVESVYCVERSRSPPMRSHLIAEQSACEDYAGQIDVIESFRIGEPRRRTWPTGSWPASDDGSTHVSERQQDPIERFPLHVIVGTNVSSVHAFRSWVHPPGGARSDRWFEILIAWGRRVPDESVC